MRPDGTLDSTGQFVNGNANGTWTYFKSNGNINSKKEFAMGQLLPAGNYPGSSENSAITTEEVDVKAEFPGGVSGWNRYLLPNLKYPVYAMDKKIQGSVIVYFQVDPEGRIHDEILLKSAEFSLDEEALRLIRQSPNWTPGTKNGQKVTSYAQQAVSFRMQ